MAGSEKKKKTDRKTESAPSPENGPRKLPVPLVILLDLLLAALIFGLFSFFLLGIPRMRTARQLREMAPLPLTAANVEAAPVEAIPVETAPAETPPTETPPAETAPAETPPAETPPAETPPAETPPVEAPPAETAPAETPPAETSPAEAAPPQTDTAADGEKEEPSVHTGPEASDVQADMEEAPAEEAEPGPHEKFADHFSEEILVTDTSYQSPNIAIEITKHEVPEKAMVYFVADIYLADPYCLVTCFPENTLTGEALKIAEANDAVLGINGDFVGYQNNGFFVRNGTVLKAEQSTADILVMYRDGSMETHTPDDYRVEDILARDPLHVWHFGPELLDADGKAKTEFNTSPNIAVVNPRTGVGYYEPGHYCFVVVDGRQPPYSSGAEMGTFAEIFESLQCKAAYNLDGGNSVYMVFDGKFANHPSFKNKRLINDMLIIREPGIDPGQEAS